LVPIFKLVRLVNVNPTRILRAFFCFVVWHI
jgi:hypothetical protein